MKNILKFSLIAFLTVAFLSCEEEMLPDAGSLPDETPPEAAFSYEVDAAYFQTVNFLNSSVSSTTYAWDFGDGNTSSEKNPTHSYDGEGTYTVKLTASDALNQSDEYVGEVVIVEPEEIPLPTILEAGFEDNSLPDGTGDGRDSWRSSFTDPIQISSSPVHDGEQAGKLPAYEGRVALQMIDVVPDNEYNLSFYYTMKADPGTFTVAIVDSEVMDFYEIEDATIASIELSDDADPDTYEKATLTFNSGSNSTVGICLYTDIVEVRFDNFEFE